MAENKKTSFTKAEFLTEVKFAKKYSISKELVSAAVLVLYKKNKLIKTSSGILTPVIIRNRASHATNSQYLIHPLFHEEVLKEIKTQEKMLLKQAKVIEK